MPPVQSRIVELTNFLHALHEPGELFELRPLVVDGAYRKIDFDRLFHACHGHPLSLLISLCGATTVGDLPCSVTCRRPTDGGHYLPRTNVASRSRTGERAENAQQIAAISLKPPTTPQIGTIEAPHALVISDRVRARSVDVRGRDREGGHRYWRTCGGQGESPCPRRGVKE